jgi:hypothetical protein
VPAGAGVLLGLGAGLVVFGMGALPASAGVLLLTTLAYALATRAVAAGVAAAPGAGPPVLQAPCVVEAPAAERGARGFLIALCAALNAGLWWVIPGGGAGPWLGVALGVPLGVSGLLAGVPRVARSPGYQALLGWSSWLRPLSWPATAVGLALWGVNFPFALRAGGAGALRLDRTTGTVETHGGITGITGFVGGFNLGNFTFITPGAPRTEFTRPGLSAHETGHTLNVAAFGSVFHYLGAIDENLPPFRRLSRAYAELLAESHLPGRRLILRQWG